MPGINGLGLSFATLTITYNAGTIDDVRVDAGTEAFTAAGATEFRRSLLVVNTSTGVVTEVAGTDTTDQTLASAVAPAVPATSAVLAVAEVSATAITDLDLTVAGDLTAVSS